MIFESLRILYIIFALVMVFDAFHQQYHKRMAEDVLSRKIYKDLKKMKYPSITFCYKYKHGTKQIMDNYLSSFYEKSKKEKCILDLFDKPGGIIKNYTGISNSSMCMELCQKNESCDLWTYEDGMCYMKDENSVLYVSGGLKVKNFIRVIIVSSRGKSCETREKFYIYIYLY